MIHQDFHFMPTNITSQDLALKLIVALYSQGLLNNQTFANIRSKYTANTN